MFKFYMNKKTKEIVRAQKFYFNGPEAFDKYDILNKFLVDLFSIVDTNKVEFSYHDFVLLIKDGNTVEWVEYGDYLLMDDSGNYFACLEENFNETYLLM